MPPAEHIFTFPLTPENIGGTSSILSQVNSRNLGETSRLSLANLSTLKALTGCLPFKVPLMQMRKSTPQPTTAITLVRRHWRVRWCTFRTLYRLMIESSFVETPAARVSGR